MISTKIELHNGEETFVFTRQQTIDLWLESNLHLNSPVCPNCRDILSKSDKGYYCGNQRCNFGKEKSE